MQGRSIYKLKNGPDNFSQPTQTLALEVVTQSQVLQAAQQKINDLRSAEKKAEDDRASLLRSFKRLR